MDTASDPQQDSEPISSVDVDDQEEELVEELDFGAPVESNWSFKHLRGVAKVSSPSLTSPQPVAKMIEG